MQPVNLFHSPCGKGGNCEQEIPSVFALAISLLCLPASITAVVAQDFRATIAGRVTDANKAAVPNAQVNVKNLGTNEITSATTDSEGNYKAPFLRPGSYSITVEMASGFKKATRDKVELVISQVATLDFALEAGAISEQVTVQGDAQVETATADRGGVIDRQKVIELPLNARNPFMLGMLTAGVNFNGAAIWQRPFDNGAIADWTINGSQSRGNEFLLDGAPEQRAGGRQQHRLRAAGRLGAGVQDHDQQLRRPVRQDDGRHHQRILRSGTNDFHGTLYEFTRREALDANDYPFNASNQREAGITSSTSTASRSKARCASPGSITGGTRPSSCSTTRVTAKASRTADPLGAGAGDARR